LQGVGTGVVAIDFASRIGNVQTTYKADGNRERALFIEPGRFAVGVLDTAVIPGLSRTK